MERITTRRAVFLDRDGVLNRALVHEGKPYAPTKLEEFEIFSTVPEGVRRLREGGYLAIVVTNQPDVARGRQTRETIEAMHRELFRRVPIDDIRVCYHSGATPCECRKPQPGMLLSAAREWKIDLASSFMVGDRWRDIEAGRAAGCHTVLIDYGYDEPRSEADWVVFSFGEAVEKILEQVKT